MIQSKDLLSQFSTILKHWHGSSNPSVTKASSAEEGGPGDLVFASQQMQLNIALERRASVIVAAEKLSLSKAPAEETLLLKTPHVGLAMAKILPLFDIRKSRWATQGVHPLSVIHPSAKLGQNVTIEAFVTIGENVSIGDSCFIGSNTVIESGSRLGSHCRIHPQVFIGANSILGRECELHPQVTLGSDGFGYAQDSTFQHHKLPQLGRVVLGDRVEIGAGTAVDRAAFSETKIGTGTKIDNLCHIAHNCSIGENSAIAGGFMVAGSTRIGARFMTGGSTVIADHLQIADGVLLAGRSTVTKDISEPGAYGGYPTVPMKEHLRTVASLPALAPLRKQVARIMKHLNLKEEDSE